MRTQDQQREDGATCQNDRTGKSGRPINAVGDRNHMQEMANEPQSGHGPKIGTRQHREAQSVAPDEHDQGENRHDQITRQ